MASIVVSKRVRKKFLIRCLKSIEATLPSITFGTLEIEAGFPTRILVLPTCWSVLRTTTGQSKWVPKPVVSGYYGVPGQSVPMRRAKRDKSSQSSRILKYKSRVKRSHKKYLFGYLPIRKLFVNIPTMTKSNDSSFITFRNSSEFMLKLAAFSPLFTMSK